MTSTDRPIGEPPHQVPAGEWPRLVSTMVGGEGLSRWFFGRAFVATLTITLIWAAGRRGPDVSIGRLLSVCTVAALFMALVISLCRQSGLRRDGRLLRRMLSEHLPGGGSLTFSRGAWIARSVRQDCQVRCGAWDWEGEVPLWHFHIERLDPQTGQPLDSRRVRVETAWFVARGRRGQPAWLAKVEPSSGKTALAYAIWNSREQQWIRQSQPSHLLLVQQEEQALLYGVGVLGEVSGDTTHTSVTEAREFAAKAFDVDPGAWRAIDRGEGLPLLVRTLIGI